MGEPEPRGEQEGEPEREPERDLGRRAVVECRQQQPGHRGNGHHPAGHPEQDRTKRLGPVAEERDRHHAEAGGERGRRRGQDQLEHQAFLSHPADAGAALPPRPRRG